MTPTTNSPHNDHVPSPNPTLAMMQELFKITVFAAAALVAATFVFFVCVDAWHAKRAHDAEVELAHKPGVVVTRAFMNPSGQPVYEQCKDGWCTQSAHREDLQVPPSKH